MKKKISLRVIRRISFYYEALLKLNLPERHVHLLKKTGRSHRHLLQPGAPGFLLSGHFHRQAEERLPGQKTVPRTEKDPLHRPRRPGDHHRRRPHRPGPVQVQAVQRTATSSVTALFDIKKELVGTDIGKPGRKKPILPCRPAGRPPAGKSRHPDRPADRSRGSGTGYAGQADQTRRSRASSTSPPRSCGFPRKPRMSR